jgi:pimeloyl-ACP methyl ester carboxylesterase
MQPGRFDYEGATVRYQITSNAKHPNTRGPQVWALNVHGFFAGGGMYAHESRHLAKALGWRIVNPSLPGFGGSKPLPSDRVTPHEYANVLAAMMDHLGIDQAVLLGHSMGGALALAFAQAYPERTLGIVYRDGAGTTAWRSGRAGLFARILNPISGGLADVVDTVTSAIWEIPTMFAGGYKEVGAREFLPDIRHNLQHIIDMLPVLRMLFGLDLAHAATDAVDVHGIPVLTMWGVWDKITPSSCATEFAHHTRTKMVWVPGGHSWMFAQPWEQASTLVSSQVGQEFVEAAIARLHSDPINLPAAPAAAV